MDYELATVKRSVVATGDSVGFAETLCRTILAGLQDFCEFWQVVRVTSQSPEDATTASAAVLGFQPADDNCKEILREALGSIYLWSENLEQGKLDLVLERSEDLHECIIDLLCGIGGALRIGIETVLSPTFSRPRSLRSFLDKLQGLFNETDVWHSSINGYDYEYGCEADGFNSHVSYSSKAPDYIQDIQIYTTCLMDLCPTIERTVALKHIQSSSSKPDTKQKITNTSKVVVVTPPSLQKAFPQGGRSLQGKVPCDNIKYGRVSSRSADLNRHLAPNDCKWNGPHNQPEEDHSQETLLHSLDAFDIHSPEFLRTRELKRDDFDRDVKTGATLKRARYPSPPDSGYKTKKARKADKEAEPTTPTGQKQGTQMSKHGADDEDKETIEIDQGKDLQSASGHYKPKYDVTNRPWVFGTATPTAFDASLAVFLVRMEDVGRPELIPMRLRRIDDAASASDVFSGIYAALKPS